MLTINHTDEVVLVLAPWSLLLLLVFAISFVLLQLFHVHLDSTFHGWLGNISERFESLGLRGMTSCISDVFLETSLLIKVDMLLVVLDTTLRLQFYRILLALLKLVDRLPEHTPSGDLQRLAWVVAKA